MQQINSILPGQYVPDLLPKEREGMDNAIFANSFKTELFHKLRQKDCEIKLFT